MIRAYKVLVQQPFNSWTQEERGNFASMIREVISQNGIVVLGDKRCFMCGAELDDNIVDAQLTIRDGSHIPSLIINLCGICNYQVKAATSIN